MDVAGCSFCGSPRVYPRIWVQGFLPTINDDRQTYVCRDCGREGMLLRFASSEDRQKFADETREKREVGKLAAVPEDPPAEAIPILPVDAVPLLEVRGVEAIPIHRTKVVDVRFTEGRLRRGGYRVDVEAYWEAVGGPRYNAGRIYVLDLAGINHRKPNFDALRAITKRATVLLDLGARTPEDVMDGYMVDVEAVVVGTKGLDSMQRFSEIRAISEGVVPCVDFANGVVWSDRSREDRDLRVVTAALREVGFTTLAVMDLNRLGTFTGPDPRLLDELHGLDFDFLLGGGIREEDVPALRERGFPRVLIDPYTPVIRALLPTEAEPVPADAVPSPRPARDVRGAPAPG